MIKNFIIAFLAVFLIGSILIGKSEYKTLHQTEQELRAANEQLEKHYREQLEKSIQSRDSLVVILDSLDSHIEVLVRLDITKTEALSKIKGRFNSLTSQQLREEMIKVYNDAVHP